MEGWRERLGEAPIAGLFGLLVVWAGMALGHTLIVIQHGASPMGLGDTIFSSAVGFAGFALVWIGMKRPENQATILGYLGGNLIWCGWFEWTWRYTATFLNVEGIYDGDLMILNPELLMIQATTFIVIAMLIFFGANKDTRCRMFMWFHRNFKLRPDKMTPGFKRQHARTAAIETVFLIWTIYLFAIFINDPRGIKYDSIAAMVITVGFVAWGIYLITKLVKIRTLGPAFRYAIPTGAISWLPIEAFSRWGLYPEVWVKPQVYPITMACVTAFFAVACLLMYRTDSPAKPAEMAPASS